MFVEQGRRALDQLREAARRRAVLAGLVFTVVLAAGAAAGLALPPLYRAPALLVVEPGRGDPELPGELSARLDTIGQRVLSRGPLLDEARRAGLYPELAARGLWDAVVEQMKSDIHVATKATADPSGRGPVVGVTLSYRGREPAVAARVSNDLAALYLEQDARLRSQRHAGRAELLKQRLAEMQERLEARVERSTSEPLLQPGPAADTGAVERLGTQLRALREERARALERREALLKQMNEADPRRGLDTRLEGLRRELAQRRQKLTERHPDVLQLEAEIAGLEKASASAEEAPPSAEAAGGRGLREALDETDQTLLGIKRDEERLSTALASVQEGRRGTLLGAARVPARESAAVQEVYGSLLRRYEDAQLADSAEEALASRLKLLDPAVPPLRESGPPRVRLLMFAVLAAVTAAAAAALAAERLDGSFRSPADLRAFTQVPVLVSVPALLTPMDRRRRRLRLAARLAGAAIAVACLGLGSYRAFTQGHWLTAALERSR